jgi:O-antigen/teichoic acid export membrane protein
VKAEPRPGPLPQSAWGGSFRVAGLRKHIKDFDSLYGTFATSFAIQSVNVVTGVLLARTLGPQARGELAAVVLWPALIAMVGSFGVSEAIVYYSSRATTSLGTLLGTTIALWTLQSAFLLGAAFGIVAAFFPSYGSNVTHAEEIYLLYIPLWLASLYLSAFLNGLQNFRMFNFLRFLPIGASAVGLTIFAAWHHLSVRSAVGAYLLANLITALAAIVLVSRQHRLTPVRFRRNVIKHLLSYGLRSHSATVSSLANERLDQLIISLLLSSASLGFYVIAGTLTSATGIIGFSVAMVALPALARIDSGTARVRAAQRFVTLTVVVSTLVTLPLVAFTPTLIRIFFGAAYLPATTPARLLLVAAIILSTNRVLTAILRGVNRPFDAGMGELFGVVATVGAIALLLPPLGITGAALASIIAYAISTGWMGWRATRALGSPPITGTWLRIRRRRLLGGRERRRGDATE